MTRDKYGIPLYANSTLLQMPKSELLGYIRTIEHNWRSAEETIEIQADNCKKLLVKEYNQALEDVKNLTFRDVTYTDSLNDRIELRELIDELTK